jgi:hypothetical protein
MRTSILIPALILLSCTSSPPAQASEGGAVAGPYSVEVVDEGGSPLPTFERAGRTYVLGSLGRRYLLRVRNRSGQRIEVVASVDGRDVIDGRPGSWSKRGYIVGAHQDMNIDGYRLNQESVAAFRFSSVRRSYASQMGDARDVGVIGVAIFAERLPIYYPSPLSRRAPSAPEDTRGAPDAPGAMGGTKAKEGARTEAPGLGTEFGEEHTSHVYSVHFERASSAPSAVLLVHYDDRPGLAALGIDVDRHGWANGQESWRRETAEPFRRNASFAQPPPGWRR